MSYPNDAPAAAWYPDPQTPGQVRWWDGTNWTEHVSKPTIQQAALTSAKSLADQLAAPIEPEPADADISFAAADSPSMLERVATVSYIGRHAAGATPAPRQPSSAPQIRPRVRVEAAVPALSYA